MWEKKRLSGPAFDETALTLSRFSDPAAKATRVIVSDLGKSDAASKVKAWDGAESVQIRRLTSGTDASEAAVQVLAFELLRGPGDKDVILKRAADATGWDYTGGQCVIAQSFAQAVLAHGWDAAVRDGALQTTSYPDALRIISAGISASKSSA